LMNSSCFSLLQVFGLIIFAQIDLSPCWSAS
jgi:hypothetical protein